MSAPKKHHYVQRAYLHRWSDTSGDIYICDLSNGNIHRGPAKSAAWKKYYYCLEDPEHPEYRFEIEEFLANDVEGPAGPMFNKLDAQEELSQEEKNRLAIYVAFQRTRVPFFEKFSNDLAEQMAKERLLKTLNDKDLFDKIISENAEKYKSWNKIPTREEMIATVEEGRLKMKYPRGHSLKTMLQLSLPLSDLYFESRWVLLEARASSFITSDNPAVTISMQRKDESAQGETTFPVSPRHCLLIQQGVLGKTVIAEEDAAGVAEINRRTLLHATRYLFASDKDLLGKCYAEYVRLESLSSQIKSSHLKGQNPLPAGEKWLIKREVPN